MIKCCLGCPERAVGCHGKCDRYKAERAEEDAKNLAKRKYLNAGAEGARYAMQEKAKIEKWMRKKRNISGKTVD